MTPHAHRELRRAIRWQFAELRKDLAQARRLRLGNALAQEEAEGLLVCIWHDHGKARRMLKTYRTAQVVKFANLSPKAAARRAKL